MAAFFLLSCFQFNAQNVAFKNWTELASGIYTFEVFKLSENKLEKAKFILYG